MEISCSELDELNDPLIVDVRSPGEFAEDHLPGAVNLPVLDDEQRAEVGTVYNQESRFRARQLGARYITENTPDILEEIEGCADDERPVVVYCWRGGSRSRSLGHILDRIGYQTHRLKGGYRAYRRRVHAYFEETRWNRPLVTVYGLTGTGKTILLERLRAIGAGVLDLEAAASHRGSAFGGVEKGHQPSQKAFENRVYQQLRGASAPIFAEGESRNIGSVKIPDPLFDNLTEPPRVWLENSREQRIRIIRGEYDWPDSRDRLIHQLNNLTERLGNDPVSRLQGKLREDRVDEVIDYLLENYYDPAYRNSCPDRDAFDRVLDGSDLDRAARRLVDWVRE